MPAEFGTISEIAKDVADVAQSEQITADAMIEEFAQRAVSGIIDDALKQVKLDEDKNSEWNCISVPPHPLPPPRWTDVRACPLQKRSSDERVGINRSSGARGSLPFSRDSRTVSVRDYCFDELFLFERTRERRPVFTTQVWMALQESFSTSRVVPE